MAPTILRLGTAPLLVAAFALAGCSSSGSTDATSAATTSESASSSSTARSTSTTSSSSRTSPTSTTSTPATTASQPTGTSTSPASSASASTVAAPVGPQQCGSVTTVTGTSVRVRIVSGDLTCDAAEQIFRTYYADVPTQGQGSGGFLEVDGWTCLSSTVASSAATGQAGGCSTASGSTIVTEGAPQPTTSSVAPSPPPPPQATATTAPDTGGSCAQIDQPTLDQMFPDGVQDEQRCASFIGGEAAH